MSGQLGNLADQVGTTAQSTAQAAAYAADAAAAMEQGYSVNTDAATGNVNAQANAQQTANVAAALDGIVTEEQKAEILGRLQGISLTVDSGDVRVTADTGKVQEAAEGLTAISENLNGEAKQLQQTAGAADAMQENAKAVESAATQLSEGSKNVVAGATVSTSARREGLSGCFSGEQAPERPKVP